MEPETSSEQENLPRSLLGVFLRKLLLSQEVGDVVGANCLSISFFHEANCEV